MAKRKTKKRIESQPQHEVPSGFWRQVVAVGMVVMALMLVLTWFGSGGSLLESAAKGVWWLLGWGGYFVPLLLVYLAVKIFRAENNQLSVALWVASLLLVFWMSGIFGLFTVGQVNPTGGIIGEGLNGVVVQFLAPSVAGIIYVVLIFVTMLFILQVSPAVAIKSMRSLVTGKKEMEQEKKSGENMGVEFKVNSGVGVISEKKEMNLGKKDIVKRAMSKDEKTDTVKNVNKALVSSSDLDWKMPSVELLEKIQKPADPGNIKQNALVIKNTLAEFGIDVEMEGANIGPKVTQYMMKPPAGVNLSKILARDKELALNLAVDKIRIEAPIPGTRSVGVEIPNLKSADVSLRGVIESAEWAKETEPLAFAVGKDISGRAVMANLAKMPHLLVAGTTGSGKSVMTNTLITSLLYRNAPSDMKLIIIDPKQVEMAQYDAIPHLLAPIITSVDKAVSAARWAVNEMEKRFSLMAEKKVKNIGDYNAKVLAKESGFEEQGKMPYIVLIVDEMADLMMMAGKDLEMPLVRVAQKGRAAGLHLVLATQRPEAKVITGLIKANVPGRIAFAVGSQIDSRIMLDMGGAEKLLGSGDMLMLTKEMMGKPRRIQGAWASDKDVMKVTDFLRAQRPPEYNDEVISQPVQITAMGPAGGGAIGDLGRRYDPNDEIVRRAVELSISKGKFSTAMLQTYLGKGHGFVSGLAIWFEEIGVIGPANGNKPRDVLISSMEEFDQLAGL